MNAACQDLSKSIISWNFQESRNKHGVNRNTPQWGGKNDKEEVTHFIGYCKSPWRPSQCNTTIGGNKKGYYHWTLKNRKQVAPLKYTANPPNNKRTTKTYRPTTRTSPKSSPTPTSSTTVNINIIPTSITTVTITTTTDEASYDTNVGMYAVDMSKSQLSQKIFCCCVQSHSSNNSYP